MNDENYSVKGYQLNEYCIEKVLGSGDFGVTYLATDINLHTQVVIKEFLPKEFASRQSNNQTIVPYTRASKDGTYEYLLKKFMSEAMILSSIQHFNNVTTSSLDITMRLIDAEFDSVEDIILNYKGEYSQALGIFVLTGLILLELIK